MCTITVGMPVYNGEKYVELAIRSVLAQTFDDFILVIGDNASTDRTAEICQDFAALDPRVRYFRHATNVGAAANYNSLFARAKSPYFRWSNADDLLFPQLHERCLEALELDSGAVLAAGSTVLIDAEGKETGKYVDNLDLTESKPSQRLRTFFQRSGMTNVIYGLMRTDGLARTDLMGDGTVPAADTILMGQLVLQGKFLRIDEPLFYRRMHEGASSAGRSDDALQQSFWSAGRKAFRRKGWSRLVAYRRAIARTPTDSGERLALYQLLGEQLWANKRQIVRELLTG